MYMDYCLGTDFLPGRVVGAFPVLSIKTAQHQEKMVLSECRHALHDELWKLPQYRC